LKIENLHSYYGKSHILQGIHLELKEKEVVGLIGRNGMGKTTLLKSLMGIVPPTVRQGKILFKDQDIKGWETNRISRLGVGYVPEDRRIFPQLTVLENLSLGLDVMGKRPHEKKAALEEAYAHFPRLAERLRQLGESLSGGEQQMLAIARAMVMDVSVILMDEPTEGLMPLLVREIAQIIKVLKEKGISVLLVEQSAITALDTSDRIYVMEKGLIQFEGTPQDFKADEALVRSLLGV
jgi:branched-chain amino acid transport system ATP-binding protein